MLGVIKRFDDGSTISFGKGSFDEWCVYLTRPDTPRFAPLDWQYFTRLQQMGRFYGAERIYGEFVTIYDRTTAQISGAVLQTISERAAFYPEQRLRMEMVLTILYAAMIAEENRQLPLKKRIKRLGVHQLLLEGFSPQEAANFSRGRPWRELDGLCKERGF